MFQELLISLGIQNSKFAADLKKSEALFGKSLRRMRSAAVKTLGAGLGVGGLTRATRDALTFADRVDNIRQQIDATVEEVQRLDIAFSEAGLGGAERLVEGLESLNRQRQLAAEGNQDLIRSFELLGISMKDVNDAGVRSLDILQRIGRVQNITTDVRLRNAATKLISQEAGKFLGAVGDSQTGFAGNAAVLSEKEIQALDQLQVDLSRAVLVTSTGFRKLLSAFLNLNESIADAAPGDGAIVRGLPSTIRNFIKVYKKLFGSTTGDSESLAPSGLIVPQGQRFDPFAKARQAASQKRLDEFIQGLDKGGILKRVQGGIETRSIGGLAFSNQPDRVISLQNQQLLVQKSIDQVQKEILAQMIRNNFTPFL